MHSHNKLITINFINPVSEKTDKIYISERDLEELRNGSSKMSLTILSFLYDDETGAYIINLHIDKENKVRFLNKSRFLLNDDKKLLL